MDEGSLTFDRAIEIMIKVEMKHETSDGEAGSQCH
jgi:hypothetical protein